MSENLYRPGLEGIIAGETTVCSLDGGLYYRGYAVEELIKTANFLQVAYLLLHGEAPTSEQFTGFEKRLAEAAKLPSQIWNALESLPKDTNSMDVMRTGCSMLAHFDPDSQEMSLPASLAKAERLVAQMSVLLGGWARVREAKKPISYEPNRSFAANVLRMIRGDEPTELEIKAMDVSLILYAEHEYNASTFTARVVTSTLSDLHSAITAAIGALKGSLHGGANERAIEVLREVESAAEAENWIRKALAEKRRIMGFGHRVYKDGDPRSVMIKPYCEELARVTGNTELEQIADTIEKVVRLEKKLPPNVDWPSARLYTYMRIDVPLFTPLFVASRVTGWSAHALEQLGNNRLIRPMANYIGPKVRAWPGVK